MASTSRNSEASKAQQREFIQNLFQHDLDMPINEIATLPRCNNNFIHFVTFSSPFSTDKAVSTSPGTSPIPAGTTKAIFRIGNPAALFNHAVKAENTVAMMQLMREALSKFSVVPHVYAWSKTGGPAGHGWILEQHMPGSDIESEFHSSLPTQAQRHVLRQMAEVLKAVQDFELPAAASGFGGLAFDGDGNVVSGPFVVEPNTDSYPNMKSFYHGMLRAQLKDADRSRVLKGWRENGLRERLDAFAETGLGSVLSKTIVKDVKPGLIIGDIVIANLLFHPTTHKLLGLVDYDCSHTGHPLHEFFFSSFSLSYCALSDDPAVINALFHGYPSPLPPSTKSRGPEYRDDDAPQWETMAIFEEELERAGAARPSSIEGAEGIKEVYEFMAKVCPFEFLMARWIEGQSEEKLEARRRKQEKIIEKALAKWGF